MPVAVASVLRVLPELAAPSPILVPNAQISAAIPACGFGFGFGFGFGCDFGYREQN